MSPQMPDLKLPDTDELNQPHVNGLGLNVTVDNLYLISLHYGFKSFKEVRAGYAPLAFWQ